MEERFAAGRRVLAYRGHRSWRAGEGQRNPASRLVAGQFGTWVVAAVRAASN